MDTKEAMEKIDEINTIIQSSNRAIFSGERMMVIGALVALIPVIEWVTHHLTFRYDFGSHADLIVTMVHTVFYWGLFTFVGRAMPFKKLDRGNLHPLIRRAFSVGRPLVVSIIGVVFVFSAIDQPQLIHPVVFLLLGILFILYGKFSIPAVTCIAWSYIVVGLAYALLTRYSFPNMWVYFTVYNGLSYVLMGYFLRQAREVA